MLDVGRHPNIELLAYSEVEKVEGSAGCFKVQVRRKARYAPVAGRVLKSARPTSSTSTTRTTAPEKRFTAGLPRASLPPMPLMLTTAGSCRARNAESARNYVKRGQLTSNKKTGSSSLISARSLQPTAILYSIQAESRNTATRICPTLYRRWNLSVF